MKSLTFAIFTTFGLLTEPALAQTWTDVSKIFTDRCVFCHSGEFAPLGLSLDSYANIVAGSENGPVTDVVDVQNSRIIQRLTGRATPQMPLDGPPFLLDQEIEVIASWIANGAPGPNDDGDTNADAGPIPPDPYADNVITFDEVDQIFKQRCIECHSDNSKMTAPPEGLRLTSLAEILAGGDRIVVIPGNPQASEMIRRVEGLSDPRMPLDGPPWLDEAQITLLRDWIIGGALDADGNPSQIPTGGEVRFRGIMTAPNAIDGAEFLVTDGTRIDDRPVVGGEAEMRGRINADGSITATRLRDR